MDDPYVYKNGVLRNKLGIKDYDELSKAEASIGYINLITAQKELSGKSGVELIVALHKHIFSDIYDWAGEFRTVPIYKEEVVVPGVSLVYSQPENIVRDLKDRIIDMNQEEWEDKSIDEVSTCFTKHLAKIWRVHPFRDGNTRTALAYASVYARQHGFEMNLGSIVNELSREIDPETKKIKTYSVRDRFVLAALDDNCSPEPQYLNYILKKAILAGTKDKQKRLAKLMDDHNSLVNKQKDDDAR